MIEISQVKTYGWEEAVRGMRNPMNSWAQSDSFHSKTGSFVLGSQDLILMEKLVRSGPDHAKFLRMIGIFMDINAPLYWWKEFDTYKVGTVANSCSTMHKIAAKKFIREDFSCEHLINRPCLMRIEDEDVPVYMVSINTLDILIGALNIAREMYMQTNDKKYWWQMIQLLPSSYNQKRTVMLNYEVARRQYHARHNHKLDEWHGLCDAFKKLPQSQLITM